MDRLTQIRLAITVVAAILFASSMRMGEPILNWIAIGFLTVALLLRFARRPPPR